MQQNLTIARHNNLKLVQRNNLINARRIRCTVPLNRGALKDAMPAFFDLLTEESNPAVRVVLGHFIFVYIHPYFDGNGRMGRFLMNLMMAAGGYPWTVVPLAERKIYMAALERASVEEDIGPFADFLARLVKNRLEGGSLPALPKASQ